MEPPTRRIAHLDMDAFYASVELLRMPELLGLPVAIGGQGDVSRRGVVTTATYEARAFGIHSGMALRRAAELCPPCIFLPVDFDEYRRYSRRFKAAIAPITSEVEDRGIDEVYMDLSHVEHDDHTIARTIKTAVTDATGLRCSIGIAPNKLLAKLASDLEKPDGLTIVHARDVPTRIWPLPVRRINGVGPKADAKLGSLGLRTIGDVAEAERSWLIAQFGASYGAWLHDAAHGRDERPVVTHSEPQSRSRETTFERDLDPTRDRALLGQTLTQLCAEVSADLIRRGYVGRTVGVKIRFDDFSIVTRDATLACPVVDADAIRRAAVTCLKRVAPGRCIRLLGVRVANLSRADAYPTHEVAVGETLWLFEATTLK